MTTFYLGTHQAKWLRDGRMPPLFVSARRLQQFVSRGDAFPKAQVVWALDSGGFTELSMNGWWDTPIEEYAGAVVRWMDEGGAPPAFAAPQDWMCEPVILAKTGLTVRDHQQLTVENYCRLIDEYSFVPWLPVLQGWTLDDYLECADMYAAAGVDLAAEPSVGLGSVCRRQSTDEIGEIVSTLHARGLRLHGFGVKTEGLRRYGHLLDSADSLAWSYAARRRQIKLDGCTHSGLCSNCPRWALQWRANLLGETPCAS
jgi:hypothetical protein